MLCLGSAAGRGPPQRPGEDAVPLELLAVLHPVQQQGVALKLRDLLGPTRSPLGSDLLHLHVVGQNPRLDFAPPPGG